MAPKNRPYSALPAHSHDDNLWARLRKLPQATHPHYHPPTYVPGRSRSNSPVWHARSSIFECRTVAAREGSSTFWQLWYFAANKSMTIRNVTRKVIIAHGIIPHPIRICRIRRVRVVGGGTRRSDPNEQRGFHRHLKPTDRRCGEHCGSSASTARAARATSAPDIDRSDMPARVGVIERIVVNVRIAVEALRVGRPAARPARSDRQRVRSRHDAIRRHESPQPRIVVARMIIQQLASVQPLPGEVQRRLGDVAAAAMRTPRVELLLADHRLAAVGRDADRAEVVIVQVGHGARATVAHGYYPSIEHVVDLRHPTG